MLRWVNSAWLGGIVCIWCEAGVRNPTHRASEEQRRKNKPAIAERNDADNRYCPKRVNGRASE